MTKKSFKDNPALQFISANEEGKQENQEMSVPEKAPKGYKINPAFIETKSRRLQLVLQPSLFIRVKKCAKNEKISINEYVHRILNEATKTQE